MRLRRLPGRWARAVSAAALATLIGCLLLTTQWRSASEISPAVAGVRAFDAAKTQIGVPYVWGGDAPGKGFDDAALVRWAWAQAGVHIPRTSAEQFATLPEVSLNRLQPGDLLFYYNLNGDGQVDHTVMYGGRGPWGDKTTIAVDYTGTTVQLQPEFTFGLVGAGSPFGRVRRPAHCLQRVSRDCFQRTPGKGTLPGPVSLGGGDVGP